MNKIRYIIFDVGGVLLKEKIDKAHDALNQELGKKVFDRNDMLHKKALLGKISERHFFRLLAKKSGFPATHLRPLSSEKYLKIMKTNKDTIKIAKSLRNKGYKLCILSNVTPQHKKPDHVMKLYTYFDHRVLSCDVGAIKPHSKIFKIALKKLNAKPEECIYIEDRKEFLTTPKKLGINVIHFISAKQLQAELKKFGVKI